MNSEENKKIVLLVDDDFDLLMQTEAHLKSAGFEVITADGQEKAEAVLRQTRPDIVISDLMMEELDGGFSLAYHVKKKDPQIPVIIVTGVTHETGMKFSTDTEDERAWIKADAILNKPFRFEQLLNKINLLLD
jgi:DNA-binding response OmpR family regulator